MTKKIPSNDENHVEIPKKTPSEFYRQIRPEYFSDSEIKYEYLLPREVLALELDQITTNQKENEFERFAVKLAEKLIAPNLVPQTGPTGGGDGKTDSETHSVSELITERWFVPENGWDRGEKWAIAISAKHDWKPKMRSDVQKIIETKRGYTKVFFITNQKPSSKIKKELKDELKNQHGIDVEILDGLWILEKVYSNNFIDLVVDSLNLSDTYKQKNVKLGGNDASRIRQLEEIENKIQDSANYLDYDFVLVEDALETAILSRMLERPKDEIIGKFDRAVRFGKKLNIPSQMAKLHYQKAWTLLNWFDEYEEFFKEYKSFKSYINSESSVDELELYINLFNLLRSVNALELEFDEDTKIDHDKELEELTELLKTKENEAGKPSSNLIAKTQRLNLELVEVLKNKTDPTKQIKEIINCFKESSSVLNFPLATFGKIVDVFGEILYDNEHFDDLVVVVAEITAERESQIKAGHIYFKRAVQKLSSEDHYSSVVFFGKALVKLAKEEDHEGFYYSLMGLAEGYKNLGLWWAANNSLTTAAGILVGKMNENREISRKLSYTIFELVKNELMIGRIPNLLVWRELYDILNSSLLPDLREAESIPPEELMDGCLCTRLLNTDQSVFTPDLDTLPSVLENTGLYMSELAVLYQYGYTRDLIDQYKDANISNEGELNEFTKLAADQPFKGQIIYETNFVEKENIELQSKIAGTILTISFDRDKTLAIIAETALAFIESFFATSLTDLFPTKEEIKIHLVKNETGLEPSFESGEFGTYMTIRLTGEEFNHANLDKTQDFFQKFIFELLVKNFKIKDVEEYFSKLFKAEELNERQAFVLQYRIFITNLLGSNPKLLYSDWEKTEMSSYSQRRAEQISADSNLKHQNQAELVGNDGRIPLNLETVPHDKRTVFSVINIDLWDRAKWTGFGFFADQESLGLFFTFNNIDAGNQIFDEWIGKFGRADSDEKIKISIIKGVSSKNPYNYRVLVTSSFNPDPLKRSHLAIITSRFHEMEPQNDINLNKMIKLFEEYKKYSLLPAKVDLNGKLLISHNKSIMKTELTVINAWEIDENNLERMAIKPDDVPVVPDNITDPPVFKVIKQKE